MYREREKRSDVCADMSVLFVSLLDVIMATTKCEKMKRQYRGVSPKRKREDRGGSETKERERDEEGKILR